METNGWMMKKVRHGSRHGLSAFIILINGWNLDRRQWAMAGVLSPVPLLFAATLMHLSRFTALMFRKADGENGNTGNIGRN